jgi:hypothetical protein
LPARGTASIITKTIPANTALQTKVEAFLQQLESLPLIASLLLS